MGNPRDVELDIVGHDKTRGATASAGRNFDELSKRMAKTGQTSKTMSQRVVAGAKALQGAALVAAAGLAKLGVDAIKNASDAEQSIGATQQVFGKYSAQVIKDSQNAAEQFGLSANQFRESSNLIGSLFKNQGVSSDKLAAKTKTMISLGADLSAVFGGSASDAVEALGSAFKGEFDPLEKYGITLSANAIAAQVAADGHNKLTGAALKAAQSQATSELITKQSSAALGQFSAQSSTTAEQTQILKAKYTDLSAELGAKLLPIVNKVLNGFIRLIAFSGKHQTATIAAATAVGVLAAGILALNLAMLANPVGLVIVGIAALAAAFVAAYRKSETFRNVTNSVFKTVANVILSNVSLIIGAFEKFFGVLGHLPGKAGKAFRSAASTAHQAKAEVDALRASINAVKSKTVTITYKGIYKAGKGPGTAGNGLGVNLSAGNTYAAADGAGSYRTGGPQRIESGPVSVDARVFLDSKVIAAVSRTTVNDATTRAAWRANTGRR